MVSIMCNLHVLVYVIPYCSLLYYLPTYRIALMVTISINRRYALYWVATHISNLMQREKVHEILADRLSGAS